MDSPSFASYCQPLLNKLTSKVGLKNTRLLLKRVMELGRIQLFAASRDKKEYEKLRRTVTSGDKEGSLEASWINDTLADKVSGQVSDADRVRLIHDPSELRKKHSKELGHLGQVCDLNKQVIPGDSSFNTVVTIDDAQSVHLLQHHLYSNKQPDLSNQTG